MSERDDFREPVKRMIAQRSGYRCANPSCLKPTIGPDGGTESASIGVAAHITAASAGGPRYDSELTADERAAAENGIWLCQNCSRLIDVDVASHSVTQLREWKTLAEMRAYLGLRGFSIVVSRTFERLEQIVPELVQEMRSDNKEYPFTRELVALSQRDLYNPSEKPFFVYYIEEHDELLGKLTVMANYGALVEKNYSKVAHYEMTEDFIDYLRLPR